MKVSCFLMLALLVTETTNAAPLVFQSSGRQPSLLELYTSEGCSSCPPAEIWLSGLKYSPKLWSDFVPVAFHVDYWNYLGWRDPWSKEEFSDRQRAYAQAWNAQNIYTPEFVLNGREWSHGFWQKTVPAVAETGAGSLKVSSDDATHWQLSFVPAQKKKNHLRSPRRPARERRQFRCEGRRKRRTSVEARFRRHCIY